MPCQETASSIIVKINSEDKLVDYKYEKMTCGKTVGGRANYIEFCKDRHIEDIAAISFEEVLKKYPVENSEYEFLLYLEWKALNEALRQYLGFESESANYKIAEIATDKEGIKIELIIFPPKDMPEVVPCGEKGGL